MEATTLDAAGRRRSPATMPATTARFARKVASDVALVEVEGGVNRFGQVGLLILE